MEFVVALLQSLHAGIWVAIVGILITILLWYLTPYRDRWHKEAEATSEVRAAINRGTYPGGWRSVQLHITGPPGANNFNVADWYIVRATLLRPAWPVVLARAENDDYATGVFFPNDPVRTLAGKAEGRPQRFALEFFIHFQVQDDRAKHAKFQVVFARTGERRRRSSKVWAEVPGDAAVPS